MRQRIFSATFNTFMYGGLTIISILILAGINDLLLYYAGTLIVVPEIVPAIIMVVFKTVGIATLCTFPIVLSNAMIRNIQEEPKTLIPVLVLAMILVVLPAGLFLYGGHYVNILYLIAIVCVSLMIGGAGNKLQIPARFH